jgi:hypothetical protein
MERGALVAGPFFLYGVGAKCRAGIIAYTSKCLNSPGLYYVAKYIFTGYTGVHEYQMGRRRRALRTCRYSRSALAGAQGNRTKCRHHSSYFSPPLFYPLKFDALLCPFFFFFFFFDGIFSTVLWQSSWKPIDAPGPFQAKLPPKKNKTRSPPPAAPARRPICIRFVIFWMDRAVETWWFTTGRVCVCV